MARFSWTQPHPQTRPLRIYAFDPSLGRRHGNFMTVTVPFERVRPGPQGRRVEVVDFDATNQCYYQPVDLSDPDILVENGLAPSEADPRFHQQMVYAVTNKTIEHFSSALGRQVEWSRRRTGGTRERPRPLRVFPHAMQEANAYYDPSTHALFFGYFAATAADVGTSLPGQTIYSCLSHDIIAHETSHALLHDIRHFFMEPTGPDTLAFHEAFADIVALFQHFTYKEALLESVMRTGGLIYRDELSPPAGIRAPQGDASRAGAEMSLRPSTLAEERQRNVMVGLAQQFGEAMGLRAALRSALGTPPDPQRLEKTFEPHDRGAILVAAVFDAFFTIYAERMSDLVRIAGRGHDSAGELSVELANRLTAEATRAALQMLHICVRALDYCPPVDITFGDFLRALITADAETVPDDDLGYRDIIIEAFRRRGIRPSDVASYAESSLLWQPPEANGGRAIVCRGLEFSILHATSGEVMARNRELLNDFAERHARLLGLKRRSGKRGGIQPWTFHPVHRVGPDGQLRFEIVAELIQSEPMSLGTNDRTSPSRPFRGGATLVIDAATGTVRYAVYKRLDSPSRRDRFRQYWGDWQAALVDPYGQPNVAKATADFATIHRGF